MSPSTVQVNVGGEKRAVLVKHVGMASMIDGKVRATLLGTGMATCPLCKASPTQMKDVDGCLQREIDPGKTAKKKMYYDAPH